ncbi:MAG: glycine cleavage system aminomethyltransferase GcvT [Deltaproteobacteria bacterium]|nr:glycine cleavage system aminomethyltransferase GcvT [Deltaproteobacteria bacterium]
MSDLKRTPLFEWHKAQGARLIDFGGWEMPVQYQGVIPEHQTVREHVGLFDVSHMGEFYIKGDKAKDFLNRITTNDASKLYNGRCQYTVMCQPDGGVVDDLIISQISEDCYLAVVNASNIQKDFDWMQKNNQEGVELTNVSEQTALLAIQGPKAEALLNDFFGTNFSDLKTYCFTTANWNGDELTVSRTGYTGEDGFEVMLPAKVTSDFVKALSEKGAAYGLKPIGLGARDTLRLEACYSLYGHEITDQISPLEANLAWVVKLDAGDFIGREALLAQKEQGVPRKIVGLQMIDSGIPREGYGLFLNGEQVGHVTSGTHSPLLKKPIALALVQSGINLDQELELDVRGKMKKCLTVKTPFYKRPKGEK